MNEDNYSNIAMSFTIDIDTLAKFNKIIDANAKNNSMLSRSKVIRMLVREFLNDEKLQKDIVTKLMETL